jgi:hypothetical protein
VVHAARDDFRELMRFKPHKPYADKYEFLSVCLSRLESGKQHVYTRETSGTLIQYAWLAHSEVLTAAEIGCKILPKHGSVVLFDFYISPVALSPQMQFQSIIAQMVNDILPMTDVEEIYVPISRRNIPLTRAAEQLGFRVHGEMFCAVRLGPRD